MEIKNCKSNRHGTIDMEINHPVHGWIPFTASPDDKEQYCRELHAKALAGELGAIAEYVPVVIPVEQKRLRSVLSPMAFRLALDSAGLLDQAEAIVANEETPKRIKIMWEYATQFDRTHPDLISMAQAMGLTDEQVDQVFGVS